MQILLFSRFSTKLIAALLHRHGLKIVKTRPEIIICYGGDGTLLLAEAKYPGTPKILVRRSKVGNKAITLEHLVPTLEKFQKGSAHLDEEIKLQAKVFRGKKKIILPPALNDIIIRNKNQVSALRLTVKIDGKLVATQVIGDGIVVATPFGSTGYFKSITRKSFTKGIGIAFNNPVNVLGERVAPLNAKIEVTVDREGGLISSDVSSPVALNKGDKILISKSSKTAKIFT